MKLKFQAPLLLCLLVVAIGCENAEVKTETDDAKTEVKAEAGALKNELVLDNGKRWLANPETTEGIRNMTKLMQTHNSSETVDSYKTLATALDLEFNTIFKKCTMKGEAHNQLHNYHMPMIDMVKKLSGDDVELSQTVFDSMKKHLRVYENYFE